MPSASEAHVADVVFVAVVLARGAQPAHANQWIHSTTVASCSFMDVVLSHLFSQFVVKRNGPYYFLGAHAGKANHATQHPLTSVSSSSAFLIHTPPEVITIRVNYHTTTDDFRQL